MTSSGSSDERRAPAATGRAGFTMMELLMVLGIIGVLLGISVGAFRRSIPRREIARNAIVDALRQARLFAVSELAPATVTVMAEPDEWPVVSASGRRIVGTWHLEGDDLQGFPTDARGAGFEPEPMGAVGQGLALSGEVESWIDLGTASSFESTEGLAGELFVRFETVRPRTLLSKGEAFRLESDAGGFLVARIRVREPQQDGKWKIVHHALTTDRPLLLSGRWIKVAFAFDGLVLRVEGDDALGGELVLQQWTQVAPEPGAALMVGSPQEAFDGAVDEVKWGIYRRTVQELPEMELPRQPQAVRFGPDGSLDPSFHAGPVQLELIAPGARRLVVSVAVMGDVNVLDGGS